MHDDGVRLRFAAKVGPPAQDSGCQEWQGYREPTGYGRFYLGPGRGPAWAHRVALEIALGRSLDPGMQALHSCDNPPCVSAEHLREGTRNENMRDMADRRRIRAGEQHHGHRLTTASVREIRISLSAGTSGRALAAHYGVSEATISEIRTGKSWRGVE